MSRQRQFSRLPFSFIPNEALTIDAGRQQAVGILCVPAVHRLVFSRRQLWVVWFIGANDRARLEIPLEHGSIPRSTEGSFLIRCDLEDRDGSCLLSEHMMTSSFIVSDRHQIDRPVLTSLQCPERLWVKCEAVDGRQFVFSWYVL